MQKHLFLLILLTNLTVSFAQVQLGKVMTPGRENKRSEPIPNVLIQLVGAHNVEKSGDDGTFSLALGNSAKNNVFQIGSVRKAGYTIFNKSTKFPKYYPVSNVPIEIVMISTADLEREKQKWIDRGYNNAEKEYKKKLDALKKDYQKLKITENEHNKRLNELEEWYSQYQTLIEPMAEYFVHVDFEKLDNELTQITKAIADGEYIIADSLINIYAPNLDNDVEQSTKAREAIREKKAYGESIIASAMEDSIKQAQIDEHTASVLYAKYTTSVSLMRWDDALHSLKLRADLDTTNINAVFEYAKLCEKQKKFAECEKYYYICLRSCITHNDTLNIATTQNNLGNLYSDLHDYANSEKYYKLALENYEQLFQQNPDAYRADLAMTQNNLGALYSDLHDYAKSEKYKKLALENYEQLFQQNPDAYRADLAMTQNNLGNMYFYLHDYATSEKYLKFALENREQLFQQNPDAYRADLATTQNNLGILYDDLHDYATSEKYYKFALKNYEQLFNQNPEAFRADLATTQNNLGNLYFYLHDYANSEKYLKLALENREQLFNQNPDAYRADLAGTQNNLGNLYSDLHDNANSEKYYKLALENREQLFNQNPDAYRADLAMTQNNLGDLYSYLHDYATSEKYLKLALENKEQLFYQNPDAYRAYLAMTQNNLGNLYSYLHDYANSEKYYKLALENYEQLFYQNPDAYRADLAMTQNNLGILYKNLHDYANSEKYYKLALENREQLFQQNPNAYRGDLASTYWNIMLLYADMNDVEHYDSYLEKALALYTDLYKSQPSIYVSYVIELQNRKVWRLLVNGKVDEAMTLAETTFAMDESNEQSKGYLAACYNNKAYEYANNSDFESAHTFIDKAIALVPDNVHFFDSKGEILLMQGCYDEALAMWKKVLELNPNFLDDYPDGTNLSNGLKKLGLIK